MCDVGGIFIQDYMPLGDMYVLVVTLLFAMSSYEIYIC